MEYEILKYDTHIYVCHGNNKTTLKVVSLKAKKVYTQFNNTVKALIKTEDNTNKFDLFVKFLNTVSKVYIQTLRKDYFPSISELNKNLKDFLITKFEIVGFDTFNFEYIVTDSKKIEKANNTVLDIVNGKYIYLKDTNIDGIGGKYVRLTPLNKKREFKGVHLSFDIETANINGVYSMISFSLADNLHNWAYTTTEIHSNDDLINHFWNLILECCGKSNKITIDVHNLSFDLSFILTNLLKVGYKCVETDLKKPMENNTYSHIYNQGIIQARVLYGGKTIIFTDTFRIMSKSLDKISSLLESDYIIRKKSTEYDYKATRQIGEIYTYNEIIYCINDVIVLSYIKEYFSNILYGKIKLTSSSTAMSEWVLSTQYGMYNIDIYKYAISLNIKYGFINETNYTMYIKNGVFKSYYNENIHCGKNFNEFCTICNNTNISINEITNFCKKYSLVFNYCLDVKHWDTLYIIRYFLPTQNKKQFKNQEEIREKAIKYYLPSIDYKTDNFFRKAYGGGVTSVNLTQIGIEHHNINGKSIDINSSYPDKCVNYPIPIGLPKKVEKSKVQETFKKIMGKNFKDNKLYMVSCTVSVHLKTGMLPIIINSHCQFSTQTQISNGSVTRIFTLDELKTIHRVYNTVCMINDIFVFDTADFIFSAYYCRYFEIKKQSKETAFYEISKVLLNGLYGKFGENLFIREKDTTISILENGVLRFKSVENVNPEYENIEGRYLFVAIFITSFARCQLINSVAELVENGATVYYTDTDSIYFNSKNLSIKIGTTDITNIKYKHELPKNLQGNLYINDNKTNIEISEKLGAWDLEHIFHTFVAYAPKRYGLIETYIDENGEKCENQYIKCAGVSTKFSKDFTIKDIAYNQIQKTMHSIMAENGRNIIEDFKSLNYKNGNIYKCTDNTSVVVLPDIYLKIGECCKNVYGKTVEVESVIHEN